jgi:hypothetical protein
VYRTRPDGTLSVHVPCFDCIENGVGGLYIKHDDELGIKIQLQYPGVENVKELLEV